MKTQEEIKAIFVEKARRVGDTAYGANYYGGYIANDGKDILRTLVDIWIEMTDEDYHETWAWIDEAYNLGRVDGKKRIRKENDANNRRIAKMDAERKLEKEGFGL